MRMGHVGPRCIKGSNFQGEIYRLWQSRSKSPTGIKSTEIDFKKIILFFVKIRQPYKLICIYIIL